MPMWMFASPSRAAREREILALRRAAADEHRVVLARGQQRAQALDPRAVADLGAHAGDVADLLVDHRLGQPERGDVGAHQAAGAVPLLEDHDLVAERQQVVRDRQRRGTGADAGDALAVLLARDHRQPVADVVLVVRGDALQAADRDRLVLDAAAPTGGLAGAVADPAEDAGEDVRLAIDEVGFRELAERDQADVFGHVGVCRARPLAVHHAVEVIRVPGIRRLHSPASLALSRGRLTRLRRGATVRLVHRNRMRQYSARRTAPRMPGDLDETAMRIAKPLLLVLTPIGVIGGLVEAARFNPGLAFLMGVLLTGVALAAWMLVATIRREQAAERQVSDMADREEASGVD